MKSDLIEHPCLICQQPSRACGHTRADLRAYHEQCREMRRAAKPDAPRKVRHHPVPSQGSAVFADRGDDAGVVLVPVSGKLLKCRMPEQPAIRSVTDDEYCGGSA